MPLGPSGANENGAAGRGSSVVDRDPAITVTLATTKPWGLRCPMRSAGSEAPAVSCQRAAAAGNGVGSVSLLYEGEAVATCLCAVPILSDIFRPVDTTEACIGALQKFFFVNVDAEGRLSGHGN